VIDEEALEPCFHTVIAADVHDGSVLAGRHPPGWMQAREGSGSCRC
jgi:hypothetical protein